MRPVETLGAWGVASIVLASVGFAASTAPAARPGWRGLLRRGAAHHPATDAFREDVFHARTARWCVGCFTVYPSFLAAIVVFSFAELPWAAALATGAMLAGVQAVSAAGLACRRRTKALVKASLGVGLALVVLGVRGAPWPVAAKVAALVAVLPLAWASTLPRARRIAASATAEAGA